MHFSIKVTFEDFITVPILISHQKCDNNIYFPEIFDDLATLTFFPTREEILSAKAIEKKCKYHERVINSTAQLLLILMWLSMIHN